MTVPASNASVLRFWNKIGYRNILLDTSTHLSNQVIDKWTRHDHKC